MNKAQEEAVEKIMGLLLALPWDQREEVFAEVKYNSIFCVNCGMGEPDRPNARCQCENEE